MSDEVRARAVERCANAGSFGEVLWLLFDRDVLELGLSAPDATGLAMDTWQAIELARAAKAPTEPAPEPPPEPPQEP